MGVQVRTAYRGEGSGLEPLSILQRQFISFSFGGKEIEEFDLLATFESDGMSRDLYSTFDATTKQYTEIDGQLYFTTTMEPLELSFTLATDGIDEKTLIEFIHWFKPGVIRELILSEHSNRAILARLKGAPTMHMIPFEKNKEMKINGITVPVKTTEYKGSIDISFVMDFPFWYAKKTYYTSDEIKNSLNGDKSRENLLKEGISLKVILEDGIPVDNMFNVDKDVFLGEGMIYSSNSIRENEGISLSAGDTLYLYNCGTAYTQPKIEFTVPFSFDESNKIVLGDEKSYKIILNAGTSEENSLEFVLPGFFATYNKGVEILSNYTDGDSYEELLIDFKENLTDYYMRAFFIEAANEVNNGTGSYSSTDGDSIISSVKEHLDNATFCVSIDCGNGHDIFTYQISNDDKTITENCGDMIASKYLKIEGRNAPNMDGLITSNECQTISSTIDLVELKIIFSYYYL